MMKMKRFLFPLAAALMLVCGFAFNAQADDYQGFAPKQTVAYLDLGGLPASGLVTVSAERTAAVVHRGQVLPRSDMRTASAGLVFKGTMDVIQRQSTAPS